MSCDEKDEIEEENAYVRNKALVNEALVFFSSLSYILSSRLQRTKW